MNKFQLFRNGSLVHTADTLRESIQAAEHEARTILRAPHTSVDERVLRESGVSLAVIVADVTVATLTMRPASESSSGAYVDRADWVGIERPSVRFNPDELEVDPMTPSKLSDFATRRIHGREHFAWNVKCYRSPEDLSEEQFAELRAELGIGDGDTCKPHPASGTPALVFGRLWIEAAYLKGGELDDSEGPEYWAREHAWDCAQDDARELFTSDVKLYSAGRSGGWAYLEGGPDPEYLRDAEAALEEVDCQALELATVTFKRERVAVNPPDYDREVLEGEYKLAQAVDALPMTRVEFDAALAKLAEFGKYLARYVADFPRAVAWHIGANVFQPLFEEERAEAARLAEETRARDADRLARDAMRAANARARELLSGVVDTWKLHAAVAVLTSAESIDHEHRADKEETSLHASIARGRKALGLDGGA